MPAHLLTPEGWHSAPKVRASLDFAAQRRRARFVSYSEAARNLDRPAIARPHAHTPRYTRTDRQDPGYCEVRPLNERAFEANT